MAFMKLLQADSVVSGGFAFNVVFSWWEIILAVMVIVFVIYLIKRKRKTVSR
jgi:hypothetical protein